MAAIEGQVISGISRITRAKELADQASIEFMEACESYDWDAAESARERMVGHLEAFADQVAATYRLLEVTRGR